MLPNRCRAITALVTGSITASVLLALCGSTLIITSSPTDTASSSDPTEHREAGNATTGSANLSRATTPRADPASRRPFVSQNALDDDGSRFASELTEPNA